MRIFLFMTLFSFLSACSSVPPVTAAKKESEADSSASEALSKEKTSTTKKPVEVLEAEESAELKLACIEQMAKLPAPLTNADTLKLCDLVKVKPKCRSVNNLPIFHYDKQSAKKRHIKVLVLGAIHGDEPASGSLARDWIHRLRDLEPRSQWRILPVTNPDGLFAKTRVNANGVDVNRNFPTDDWLEKAQEHWRTRSKSSPRRFPGNAGGSEPETQCIAEHISDFKPDFIISIHTPYGVLDFDGPNVVKPATILPWRRLGHMPGSLGRFMWKDHKVPVLTIELRGGDPVVGKHMEDLQDIIGTVAIRSLKSLNRW